MNSPKSRVLGILYWARIPEAQSYDLPDVELMADKQKVGEGDRKEQVSTGLSLS